MSSVGAVEPEWFVSTASRASDNSAVNAVPVWLAFIVIVACDIVYPYYCPIACQSIVL
jgi:hypothetical protein